MCNSPKKRVPEMLSDAWVKNCFVVVAIVFACIDSGFASVRHCAYCQSTTTLRDVHGIVVCNKHRCNKHDASCSKGVCPRCNLERQVKNKTAKCKVCGGLGVAVVSLGRSFGEECLGVLCSDHYCIKHGTIKQIKGNLYVCKDCELAVNAERCVIEAQDMSKKRNARINEEEKLFVRLDSLFGKKLGDTVDSANGTIHEFTPNKQFRRFTKYFCSVGSRSRRIDGICATMTSDVLDLEEVEVVRLCLEKKFGCKMQKGNDENTLYRVSSMNKELNSRSLSIESDFRHGRIVLKVFLLDSKLSSESLRENISNREGMRQRKVDESVDAL